MAFSPEKAGRLKAILGEVSMVLAQLEIPLQTVDFVFGEAKKLGIPTVLDAGPAVLDTSSNRLLPAALLQKADIISPNQTELEALVGKRIGSVDEAKNEAEKLLSWGARAVVLKLGSKGSYLLTDKDKRYFPAFNVQVVDTTGAGDAFMGALCLSLAQGKSLTEAVERANLSGACAVMRLGAQPSLPTPEEISRLRMDIAN